MRDPHLATSRSVNSGVSRRTFLLTLGAASVSLVGCEQGPPDTPENREYVNPATRAKESFEQIKGTQKPSKGKR